MYSKCYTDELLKTRLLHRFQRNSQKSIGQTLISLINFSSPWSLSFFFFKQDIPPLNVSTESCQNSLGKLVEGEKKEKQRREKKKGLVKGREVGRHQEVKWIGSTGTGAEVTPSHVSTPFTLEGIEGNFQEGVGVGLTVGWGDRLLLTDRVQPHVSVQIKCIHYVTVMMATWVWSGSIYIFIYFYFFIKLLIIPSVWHYPSTSHLLLPPAGAGGDIPPPSPHGNATVVLWGFIIFFR